MREDCDNTMKIIVSRSRFRYCKKWQTFQIFFIDFCQNLSMYLTVLMFVNQGFSGISPDSHVPTKFPNSYHLHPFLIVVHFFAFPTSSSQACICASHQVSCLQDSQVGVIFVWSWSLTLTGVFVHLHVLKIFIDHFCKNERQWS